MEEEQQQKIKEIPGTELITSPRYTMIPTRKDRRESNHWQQIESAIDLALGHRYSCWGACFHDKGLPGTPAIFNIRDQKDRENR